MVNGGTPSSSEEAFWDGEINWLTPDDLGKNESKQIKDSHRTLSKQGLENCGAQLSPKGTIIISTRAPIGHVAIADIESCTNQGCRSLIPGKGVSSDYYYYVLIASKGVLQASGKGTTFMELTAGTLGSHPVPIPMLIEQQAISEFLDAQTTKLDTLVAKKQELIEKLKEKRAALVSQTVTRGLPPEAARAAGLNPHPKFKPSGIEWLGEIPAHWDCAQLRRFTRFITSGSRGWAEYYTDNGSIFIRIGNLTRDSINLDLSDIQYVAPPIGAEGERTRIVAGDVLFSITAYLGSVAVATEAVAGSYINQHIALVRLSDSSLTPKFVAYSALADIGQHQLNGQAYGGTKVQLALDDVKSLWLTIPPLPEQQAIVNYLDRETDKIDRMIEKVEAAIKRLHEYRTALITAAVTGKIDVRFERPLRQAAP